MGSMSRLMKRAPLSSRVRRCSTREAGVTSQGRGATIKVHIFSTSSERRQVCSSISVSAPMI